MTQKEKVLRDINFYMDAANGDDWINFFKDLYHWSDMRKNLPKIRKIYEKLTEEEIELLTKYEYLRRWKDWF